MNKRQIWLGALRHLHVIIGILLAIFVATKFHAWLNQPSEDEKKEVQKAALTLVDHWIYVGERYGGGDPWTYDVINPKITKDDQGRILALSFEYHLHNGEGKASFTGTYIKDATVTLEGTGGTTVTQAITGTWHKPEAGGVFYLKPAHGDWNVLAGYAWVDGYDKPLTARLTYQGQIPDN